MDRLNDEQIENRKASRSAYYLANKERMKAAMRAWREANPEKVKALREKQYEKRKSFPNFRKADDAAYRARNAEKVRAAKEAYRLANLEKVRAAKERWRRENPDKLRAAQIRWDRLNPDKKRVHRENRRARERGAAGALSPNIDAILMKKQRAKCACCHCVLPQTRELDHIVPLARGGANDDSNMQLLCRTCNRRKGRKDPVQFMRERGLLL